MDLFNTLPYSWFIDVSCLQGTVNILKHMLKGECVDFTARRRGNTISLPWQRKSMDIFIRVPKYFVIGKSHENLGLWKNEET